LQKSKIMKPISERIHVWLGDITQQRVDAIVNAANHTLLGGGGVDGAIHRAAGPELLRECQKIRATLFPSGLPTGAAVLTAGYNLPAGYVIHTVGPVWYGGRKHEAELLRQCYISVLEIAGLNRLKIIAIPAISTGAYHYPKIPAAQIAIKTTIEFLSDHDYPNEVIFCVLTDNHAIYQQVLAEYCLNINEDKP